MTGAVLTETDHTGRKLKTFVPASGATLAEQEMVTIGGTTTEKLTFIHQDPSLAGLERTDRNGNVTNLRAGEYDALGRNVADAGPYVTLDTSPPAGDQGSSGINLDGSAQGYRPGRMNYFADGLPVPEDYVRDLFNSGRIGGVFGVVEATVRISNTAGEWIDTDGPCTLANGAEIRVGVATHLFLLGSSWGPSGLINDVTDDELDAALRALAGPGWGPNGGSEFLDDLVSPFIQSWNKESECATRLSQLFGNGTSVVATVLNPPQLTPVGFVSPPTWRIGDESPSNGTIHIYASWNGAGLNEINVFAPSGYSVEKAQPIENGGSQRDGFQNELVIRYAAGTLTRYGFGGALRINFTHIGPTNRRGRPMIIRSGPANVLGSVPIGIAGAFGGAVDVGGGSDGFGTHTHVMFSSNGRKIDPRSVFCADISRHWWSPALRNGRFELIYR